MEKYLLEPRRVAHEAVRQGRGDRELQTQALGGGALAHDVLDASQDVAQGEAHALQGELPGFDAREVQNVVDDGDEVLARVVENVDVLALTAAELGLAQQVGHADDRVQRGAYLVAHGRQKPTLGVARRLGFLLGLGQGRAGPRPFVYLSGQQLVGRLQLVSLGLHLLEHVAQAHHRGLHGCELPQPGRGQVHRLAGPLHGVHGLCRPDQRSGDVAARQEAHRHQQQPEGGQGDHPQHPGPGGGLLDAPQHARGAERGQGRLLVDESVEQGLGLAPCGFRHRLVRKDVRLEAESLVETLRLGFELGGQNARRRGRQPGHVLLLQQRREVGPGGAEL